MVVKEISLDIKVNVAMRVRVQENYTGNILKDVDIDYTNREDVERQIDAQIIKALVAEGLIEKADYIGGHTLIGFTCSVWQHSK